MNERPTPEQLRQLAEALVSLGEAAGLVLTVEQVSQQPPRMGNYTTVVSVRPALERGAP